MLGAIREMVRPGRALLVACIVAAAAVGAASAASKSVDLDGDTANGDESRCDLNVITTFPVKIENVVTNRALDRAFDFRWPSAGPGGFTSSAASGTSEGVGAKWTWTTNQSVFSFTGDVCEKDICFLNTLGPGPADGTCSRGCADDGVSLFVDKGAPGEVVLDWTGGDASYTVFRSTDASAVPADGNELTSTDLLRYVDTSSGSDTVYYVVRGATCNARKACTSDADCNEATEGSCYTNGPFSVPGRSLTPTDITVSSSSLTSSLITFFSPPRTDFLVTSIAQPGGVLEEFTNTSDSDVTVLSGEQPPGCCPEDPEVPEQLRCGDECVDYLNDPQNCGACGNVCGADECCSNGNCVSLCPEGQVLCDGQCVDLLNDSGNCGACGNACEGDACCNEGVCVGFCEAGNTFCGDGLCADLQSDAGNCGDCGTTCAEGECCEGGACAPGCAEGQILCDAQCVDPLNDNANCGTCGNACPEGTCCFEGACASVCGAGDTYCGNGQCADLVNDSANCGTCGNVCPEGTCCNGGTCASVCEEGRNYCPDGLCYDLQNDPFNCGACGNECGDQAVCAEGQCVPCDGKGGAKDACDNRCVNLNTDPFNCGACGAVCEIDCPSGFTGVCSNGNSCRCEEGTPVDPPPPNTPVPTDPFCPNPAPSPGPVPGVCPNPSPTTPVPSECPDQVDPVAGGCVNPNPTSPIAPVCPDPGPPAPAVDVAPICDALAIEETIPPGGTATICRPGGVLFREEPTVVTVCGDSIPGPDEDCGQGVTNKASGTFIRFVPDEDTEVGDAFVTPFAVQVVDDTTGDALIAPGETANLFIEVLNAGPVAIEGATATVVADPVDLTEDGVENPVALDFSAANASDYGTIAGTQPSIECEPLVLEPARNQVAFQVTVPEDHPVETAHPFVVRFEGTVNGEPYAMDMPIAIGIVDRCVIEAGLRDFDGVDGLLNPLTDLVPEGDPVPFPNKSLNAGKTVPMKMRVLCGGVELRGAEVDAPEIIGLSEETRGDLDILALGLNDDSDPDDLFFRFNETTKQWIFNMRTSDLGTGRFTIEILVAGRKSYFAGFELR